MFRAVFNDGVIMEHDDLHCLYKVALQYMVNSEYFFDTLRESVFYAHGAVIGKMQGRTIQFGSDITGIVTLVRNGSKPCTVRTFCYAC